MLIFWESPKKQRLATKNLLHRPVTVREASEASWWITSRAKRLMTEIGRSRSCMVVVVVATAGLVVCVVGWLLVGGLDGNVVIWYCKKAMQKAMQVSE